MIEIGINKPFPIDLVGVVSEIAKPQKPKIDKINIKHLTKLHVASKTKIQFLSSEILNFIMNE